MKSTHVVLLDLYYQGHHRSYVEMIARYWFENRLPGKLTVLVSSEFVAEHQDFVQTLHSYARDLQGMLSREAAQQPPVSLSEHETLGHSACSIHYHVLSKSALGGSTGFQRLIAADKAHHAALKEAIELDPTHIVCMFFDHAQRAVSKLNRELISKQIAVLGILFRFIHPEPGQSFKDGLKRVRKAFFLKNVLNKPALGQLFCLDPLAVQSINPLTSRHIATWLPDGTEFPVPDISRAELRSELGLTDADRVFLFFGVLSERKGLLQVLEAFENNANSATNSAVLLIAGKPDSHEKEMLENAIVRVQKTARVVFIKEHISDERMATLFETADFVLATYPRHIGSSGVLIRAAAAGKPVIGSNYGMMGRNIESNKLGVSIDSSNSETIQLAIQNAISSGIESFDEATSREFAENNSATQFAATILGRVFPDSLAYN